MIKFNPAYFVAGEVTDAYKVVTETNYFGETSAVWSMPVNRPGKWTITRHDGRRQLDPLTFDNFGAALRTANGYWSTRAIWHEVDGRRIRVMGWH